MNAPSITPAQIVAAIGAVLGILVSTTIIDDNLAQAITAAVATVVPAAFLIADAILRFGRAKAIGLGAKVVDGKMFGVSDAVPPPPRRG